MAESFARTLPGRGARRSAGGRHIAGVQLTCHAVDVRKPLGNQLIDFTPGEALALRPLSRVWD